MTVTLLKKDRLFSLVLPEKPNGQFPMEERGADGKDHLLFNVEGVSEEWNLKPGRNIGIYPAGQTGESAREKIHLQPLQIYELVFRGAPNEHIGFIYCEPTSADRQYFSRFYVPGPVQITVGRAAGCDVVYANGFISATHAVLAWNGQRWTLNDNNSANGVFVNGQRGTRQDLAPGDCLYIMGLRIVVGNAFFAINNPDGKVAVTGDNLVPLQPQEETPVEDTQLEDALQASGEEKIFSRSPRFKRDIERALFHIDSPPANEKGDEMPLMLTMGPSMTMGMASMSTGIFAINNAMASGNISAALPSIVMSGSMLLGTLLWPTLSRSFGKRHRQRKEKERQVKYREYLDRVAIQFSEEIASQEEILHENFISVDECVDRIENVERDLWERSFRQDDFLVLRAGHGTIPLVADLVYSERKFSVSNDHLEEELYTLCERPKELKNVPITISLFKEFVTGVIGERQVLIDFAKGLAFQLAAFYSYDEVKLVFMYDKAEEESFAFARWLPHAWSEGRAIRFIGTDKNDVKEISAFLEKELEARAQTEETARLEKVPYYIIFALDKDLATRTEIIKQVLAKKGNNNFSVLAFYDQLQYLPKECTSVIELAPGVGKIYDPKDTSGNILSFVPDMVLQEDANRLSVRLANIKLDSQENSFQLPTMIAFLNMFGVGKVEHLNPLTRWKENDPTKTLEAPIGVDTMGDLFKLDLHEKYHGPHGLVAGMTGSGKSEFIMTYILSLAVNYHPNELAFILIDYKGGGMAKAFEHLPHTAGIITNLDGGAVTRSLVSIESELKRRQAIFVETGKKVEVSNIDIYKYQKLYREGVVNEPLQHLFIISDEFAELKTQQPAFMAKLISAARIGRSLGVHLILATQKPSGVVDDQIWSNSKFRVCLKVQERADSMDMLKRDDAANLTVTGRFYLQVGYNELFEMGQSAWAGAPYYPSDEVVQEKDNRVQIIDNIGRVIRSAKPENKRSQEKNPPKQLDAITEYLAKIAQEEGIRVRQLWLQPIAANIYQQQLEEKYPVQPAEKFVLNPLVGEYDDPVNQRQCPLYLPISQDGNVIIYGVAGSGKTTFINGMLYSIMRRHTPDEVNFYLLDFAAETLRAFAAAPHVGDVILSYEAEKIANLFKNLQAELGNRKKLFSGYGGDYVSYISQVENGMPNIVVVINNAAAFSEMYSDMEDALYFLTREGTKYGMFFVLAANATSAIRYRLQQNFNRFFVLQMNDESEYANIVGRTDGLFPAKHKGRGLFKEDGIFEFQTAYITQEAVPYQYIQAFAASLAKNWAGGTAKRVPVLPKIVDIPFVKPYLRAGSLALPVGVETATMDVHYYSLEERYVHQISASDKGYLPFLNALIVLWESFFPVPLMVFDLPLECACGTATRHLVTAKDSEQSIDALFEEVVLRNNQTKEALENAQAPPVFEPMCILINSYAALVGALGKDSKEKLQLILEKGERRHNIVILIAEAARDIADYTYDSWYKKQITQTDGIWVGPGIADQYVLKIQKVTAEMRKDISEEFGFVVAKGRAKLLKLLRTGEEENDG